MLQPTPRFDVPPGREPILNLPGVISILLLALAAIHAARVWLLDDAADFRLVTELAVIPARWLAALDPGAGAAILKSLHGGGEGITPGYLAYARFVLDGEGPRPWSAVSYAFLHGSLAHLALNGVWLAAFGTPVARRFGPMRFLALSGLATIGGAAVHVLSGPSSLAPMVGASAAVSGMMAAAARFAFARDGEGGEVHLRPAHTLAGMARDRRAALFVAVWFVTNAMVGVLAGPLGIADPAIAWQAHMGGFLAGLLAFPLLDPVGGGRPVPTA